MTKFKYFNKFFALSLLMVIFDQISKLWVKGFHWLGINHDGMAFGESKNIIGNLIQCTFVENEGMAFGIGFGSGKLLLSIFRTIASIGLIYYLYKLKDFSKYVKLGIALILAGAIGNLIDSLFYGVLFGYESLMYGRVVDFIHVDVPDFNLFGMNYTHWWIFNVADACVTCGIIVLLIFHSQIPSMKEVFGKDIHIKESRIAEEAGISENS